MITPAPLVLRFINKLVDFIICFILTIITGLMLDAFTQITFYENDEVNKGLYYLISFIGIFLYYMFYESLFRRTPGKLITGTIVVTKEGAKPDASTILLRTLCRFIPFEYLSYFGKEPLGWHDSITDTVVARKKILEEIKKNN